jgi:predicted PolB exonuclease-like 3'-5' exonuclease
LQGKKPWETGHLDTLELWKFGDYKSYTSLDLLSAVLGIPSPKDDISGADVGRVYWTENGLDRIRIYCEKDVVTTCQILLRMNLLPVIEDEAIEIVTE